MHYPVSIDKMTERKINFLTFFYFLKKFENHHQHHQQQQQQQLNFNAIMEQQQQQQQQQQYFMWEQHNVTLIRVNNDATNIVVQLGT